MENRRSINLPNQDIRRGISNLFDDYAHLEAGTHVIISFWQTCDETAAWLACELAMRNFSYDLHLFNHRDEERYISEMEYILKQSQAQKIVIFVCEDKKLSFSKYLKSLHLKPHITVWRMMNSGADLFSQSLIVSRNDIRQINAWLLSKLRIFPGQSLEYENLYGTHLKIKLDNDKYSWVSSHGFPSETELITLPIGEVNTFPAEINGVFVVYGAVHANISLPFDIILEKNHLTLFIENGVLKDFECKDSKISYFFNQAFEQDHVMKVAEFGIGTNVGVRNFVNDNSHINERFPGVHLGFGQHLQSSQQLKYQTHIHIDFINPHGILQFESGEKIDLSQLKPHDISHPEQISSEDVESVQL